MAVGLLTLGIIIGIIGQGISALGLILQKRAHANIEADKAAGKAKQKKWFLDYRWWVAFIIFFSGNLCQVLALTFATQSIISALVVLVLVFNAIMAPFLLKGEKLQKIDIVGVVIIIIGVVFVVVWGPRSEKTFTSDELLNLWIKTPFVIYGLIILGIVVVLIVFNHVVEKNRAGVVTKSDQAEQEDLVDKKKKRHHHDKTKVKYNNQKEFQAEKDPDDIARKELEDKKKRDAPPPVYGLNTRFGKFVAATYAVLPAILSSFNALFSKIMGEVVLTTAKGNGNQFAKWPTYLFLVLFVIVDVTQVVYLQRALRSYSALYIIPLYQVSLTVFGVATGGIFFEEFNTFSNVPSYYPALFVIGILTAVSGVVVLSKRKPTDAASTATESEKDSKGVEEGAAAAAVEETIPATTATPEGIMSEDPEKEVPPVNFGTLLVFAVLSGTKWYLKQGEYNQVNINDANPEANPNAQEMTSDLAKTTELEDSSESAPKQTPLEDHSVVAIQQPVRSGSTSSKNGSPYLRRVI